MCDAGDMVLLSDLVYVYMRCMVVLLLFLFFPFFLQDLFGFVLLYAVSQRMTSKRRLIGQIECCHLVYMR